MISHTNTSPAEYFEYFCKDKVAVEKYEKVLEDVLYYQEEVEIARFQLECSEERVYKFERLIETLEDSLNPKNFKKLQEAINDIGIEV